MKSLQLLIAPFLEVCLFRAGPQTLPASSFLLKVTLATYTVTTAIFVGKLLPLGPALAAALVATFTTCALPGAALFLLGKQPRITQTLIAMTGCGTLFNIVVLGLSGWLPRESAPPNPPGLAHLLMNVAAIWNFVVYAHILRHALAANFMLGLGAALMLYLSFSYVFKTLFPEFG